jgi:M3 family oligoendopeptidase
MTALDFQQFELPAPTYDGVASEYGELGRALDAAATGAEAVTVVEKWDALRRRLATWSTLVKIRFHQDTRKDEYKVALEYCDELEPKLTNLAVGMKRRLTESPHRPSIEARFGSYAFELWKCDIAAFDPAIEDDLVEHARLIADYTELMSSGKFEFLGQSLTLSELMKYNEHPDRAVRRDASRLRWRWFGENGQSFDTIFQQLVRLRQTMAEKLGQANFIRVGYQRMQRVDYDEADVERFRTQVRELVVPLATELRRRQARELGVDPLMAWDEAIHDPAGDPKPQGDHDWMVNQASKMFAELGGGMEELFARMRAENLMDLNSREGKAGGGFCEVLPDLGMPFIFANSNGTMRDVTIFTHEMGHAIQSHASLGHPLLEYVMATADSAEIHSLGLEFLSWPQMRNFFGEDAARYCRTHLTQMLLFVPYGVAVDHFQHLVYAKPQATPDERAAMWQEMERMYLPSLRWGDLDYPASGRRWQAQLHIYVHPFYYIDYTLALTCALQLWMRAASNRPAAIKTYLELCRRGGEAPFGELVKSGGLDSPFEEGCLARVVEHVRRELAV